MASYARRVVRTTRVEFVVPAPPPWGATWAEVGKAFSAATQELREQGGHNETWVPADDQICVDPRDEDIVVSYEFREVVA